jgi:hypothetical protein
VGGFFFELFDENPVFGDFAQSLTIRGTTDSQSYWAGSPVSGQSYHSDVMTEIFTPELSANTHFLGHF